MSVDTIFHYHKHSVFLALTISTVGSSAFIYLLAPARVFMANWPKLQCLVNRVNTKI